MQIQKTNDYSLFKGMVGNRKLSKPHLNSLVVAIQKDDMLAFNPIIVNKRMNVIDGQHRLMAAQTLDIPIYYVVSDNASLDSVRLLNQNNRAWTTGDYLESYIALGYSDYAKLKSFAKEYSLSISYAMLIAANRYTNPHTVLRQFREGNFVFEDKDKAENMASLVNALKHYCTDGAWKDRDFLRALALVIERVDQKKLLHKLDMFSLALTRRNNTRDYIRQFTDALNFRQRVENHISLEGEL